jgi:hypothetical protein
MKRLLVISVLCCCTASSLTFFAGSVGARRQVNDQSTGPNVNLKASGGFIQLNEAEMKFKKWPDLIRELNGKAGMDTFIIQGLFYHNGDVARSHIALKKGSININDPQYDPSMVVADDDPTNAILTYADQSYKNQDPADDIKVHIGLWMDEMPYGTVIGEPLKLEAYLKGVADKMAKVADLAWNLYHQHPSFRGWYLPHEFWNFPYGDHSQASQAKGDMFKKFLRDIMAVCKTLNKKTEAGGRMPDRPVSISVYFNPWLYMEYAGPDPTEELYKTILANSGLDTLIVQDSVGTRCLWNEKLDNQRLENKRVNEMRPLVPRFMKAFSDAASAASDRNHRINLWDDVELFEVIPDSGGCRGDQPYNDSAPLRPTAIERLQWQFNLTLDPSTDQRAVPFDAFVMFDLFHYLNTIVPEGYGTATGNTQALRTKLLNDYVQQISKPARLPKERRVRGAK